MNKHLIVIIPSLIIILIRLKPFDTILRPLCTLVHELSHALVALLFKDKIKEIKLNSDFSGSCTTKSHSKFASFCVSLAGYTLTGVFAYLLIRLIHPNMNATAFYILIIVSIIALILYIRNSFGRVWTLLFVGINLIFIFIPFFRPFYHYIIYFYACILLVENFLSTIILLQIALSTPKKAGDATNLKKITKIPASIWAIFFFCFALFMFYESISYIIHI